MISAEEHDVMRTGERTGAGQDGLDRREAELDRRERELTAAERALDSAWASHEQRLRHLSDLEDYVREQEMTLRARASRLAIPPSEVETLVPHVDRPADDSVGHAGVARERAAVAEERERLVARRTAALETRRATLFQAATQHSSREQALIMREQALADAFRALVSRAGRSPQVAVAGVPPVAPRATPSFETRRQNLGDIAEMTGRGAAIEPVVPTPGCESRRYRRIELNVRVDFGTPHNFYQGSSANIGVGGLFIATRNLLQVGRIVRIRLTLPSEGPLEVEGEVAWRRTEATDDGPAGLGIRFVDLDDPTRDAVERFVEHRTPDLPA